MDSTNHEHISDDTTSPESGDTKGDGNNTSENTRSSRNMAVSTRDPDNMRTVEIDAGPTDSANQVYQTKVTHVKHPVNYPRTFGLGQLHQKKFRVTSSNRRALHLATNSKRSKPIALGIAALQQDGSNKEQSSCTSGFYSSSNQLSDKFCTKQTVSTIRAR